MTIDFTHAHSERAEQIVLGTVMLWPKTWSEAADVIRSPGMFYKRDHQIVAWAVMDRVAKGIDPSNEAITDFLMHVSFQDVIRVLKDHSLIIRAQDSLEYADTALMAIGGMNGCTDLCAVGSKPYMAQAAAAVANHYRQRMMMELLDEAAHSLSKANGRDFTNVIADTVINGSARIVGGVTKTASMGEALEEVVKRLRSGIAVFRSTWGVKSLDDAIQLRSGRFVILAAQPGGGKSSLALQAAMATWRAHGPHTAAICSLEMPSRELSTILAGAEIGVSRQDIENATVPIEKIQQMEDIAQHWRSHGAPSIKESDEKCSVNDFASWVRQLYIRSGGKLRLVVCDYLQILDATNPRHSSYDRICEVTRAVKRLANDLNICVLGLAQMNREGRKAGRDKTGMVTANPEPRMEDLAGSGTLEQDSDGIVFLWPRGSRGVGVEAVTAKIAKNRGGKSGTLVDLDFNKADGQRFTDGRSMGEMTGDLAVRTFKMNREVDPAEDVF